MRKAFPFPRRFRITNSDDFTQILRDFNTKKIFYKYFTFFVSPTPLSSSKLGVITSKKNFPTAVARNRLKRIARESFRLHCSTIVNISLLVMFNKSAALATNHEIFPELDKAFTEIKPILPKKNS